MRIICATADIILLAVSIIIMIVGIILNASVNGVINQTFTSEAFYPAEITGSATEDLRTKTNRNFRDGVWIRKIKNNKIKEYTYE